MIIGDPNSFEAPYLVILCLACLMSDCQWDGGKSHKLTCALFARVSSQHKSYTIWNIDISYAWPKFNLRLIPFLWLGFILYSTVTSSSTKAQKPYSNSANLFDDGLASFSADAVAVIIQSAWHPICPQENAGETGPRQVFVQTFAEQLRWWPSFKSQTGENG